MTAHDLPLEWAARLVAALVRSGVSHAVVSPGSRSTPLALAVAGAAHLQRLVVVDERCAAFAALGMARATGRPALLVCTSGSAGAHYLPAVIEAAEADVPLLVITADRPPELHARGALQTTDQSLLYGRHTRLTLDLGVPEPGAAARRGLEATAALAVARTLDPRPGPVHLNAPFRKPLEPTGAWRRTPRVRPPRIFAARRAPDAAGVAALALACASEPRGLVLAGPAAWTAGDPAPLAALAERLGYPVVAETASGLRGPGSLAGPAYLAPPDGPVPELVLQLGRFPTSIGWARWLEEAEVERWVVAAHGVHDPANRAAAVVAGEPELVVGALLESLPASTAPDPAWGAGWRRLAARAAEAVQAGLAEEEHAGVLSETGAAAVVLAGLPSGARLVLGNSLAVREVDRVPPPPRPLEVLAQRGVSGIDGTLSGAAGAAIAGGGATVLLTGDLALLHDLGGLAVARRVGTPLVLVILANDGGRLFELLPVADALPPELFRELFLTPEALEPDAVAAAFGLPVRRAATPAGLRAALAASLEHAGATLVVAHCGGPDARARRTAFTARVRAALTAGP